MARIEVPMPQMGESIAEGTVSKWMKKVGDTVGRDEPLLEISTDKVDAEIPSPAAGTLVEVTVSEGQTVEVGTVLGYIDTEAGAAAAAPQAAAAAPAEAEEKPAPQAEAKPAAAAPAEAGEETAEERLRQKSSPLVRRIAEEENVDISQVKGTGQSGRVTKNDMMSYLEQRQQPAPAAAAPAPHVAAAPQGTVAAKPAPAAKPSGPVSSDSFWEIFHSQVKHPAFSARENDRVQPMDRIRRLTADHMVRAKRIAPHVHSFIEIDFTQIDRVRAKSKGRWEQQGVKVSYTAFVAWAVARLMREFPMINATVSDDSIIYRGDVNIGIAVDLNPGLIVPVVKSADDLNLAGVARRINDLAERARSKKLKPDEVQGATFSITNPGVLGTLVGMPIIPEGTAAILGTGSIEKRVVVIENDGQDTMAIRKRSYFSLGYDHRLVDGADAARFLAKLKETLETFPEDA